jgi:hypothetical protein
MNISEIIHNSLRGQKPRRRSRGYGPVDFAPPEEFLKNEVWPLLKEARGELEVRGFSSIATRPAADDPSHAYALLILDGPEEKLSDACFLRFQIVDGQVCVRVKNPARNDAAPVPLDPPGRVLLVKELIEEFIFACLTPELSRERDAPGQCNRPRPHESEIAEFAANGFEAARA